MSGPVATFASGADHDRLVAAALTYLEVVAEVSGQAMGHSPDAPARHESTTAVQGLLIAMGRRHPRDADKITRGLGIGVGGTIASTCEAAGVPVQPFMALLADGLGLGLAAGQAASVPRGTA